MRQSLHPSPFPADESLGLPPWCPYAPTDWDRSPVEGYWPIHLAMRAASLTPHGRVAILELASTRKAHDGQGHPQGIHHGEWLVGPTDGRLLELYIRAHRTLPPTQLMARELEALLADEGVVTFRDFLLSLAVTESSTANAVIVAWLSNETRAGASRPPLARLQRRQDVAGHLIRASFAWGLPWTTAAPAQWWWRWLESLMGTTAGDHALLTLPPTFLPPRIVERLPLRGEPRIDTALRYLYSGSVTPTFVGRLLAFQGPSADRVGHTLARYLTTHRQPTQCVGDDLATLVGHPHPALAAVGLSLITQHRHGTPRG
jgi:hypothetical protein